MVKVISTGHDGTEWRQFTCMTVWVLRAININPLRMNVKMDLDVCWGQGEETAIFMPSKPCYIFHIYIVFRIINMMKKAIDI